VTDHFRPGDRVYLPWLNRRGTVERVGRRITVRWDHPAGTALVMRQALMNESHPGTRKRMTN
jgi:hypothetical protein